MRSFVLGATLSLGTCIAGCGSAMPPVVSSASMRALTLDEVAAVLVAILPPLDLGPSNGARGLDSRDSWGSEDLRLGDDAFIAAALAEGRYVLLDGPGMSLAWPADEPLSFGDAPSAVLATLALNLGRRYGEPLASVRVDAYGDRARFAARLGGRLRVEVDGAFADGRVMLRTPAGGARCWSETLAHELAHARQAQVGGARAPAWLLEGLAEVSSSELHPDFRRELDLEMADVLGADAEGLLDRIDGALRSPPSERASGGAYAAAFEVVVFLEHAHGADATRRLLAELDRGLGVDDAISVVVQGSRPGFERAFFAGIASRLAAARAAHLAPLGHSGAGPAVDAAVNALVRGEVDVARLLADGLVESHGDDVVLRHLAVRIALSERSTQLEARLRTLASVEPPRFEATLALAEIELRRGDLAAATREARRALDADSSRIAAWDLMLRLADRGAPGVDRAEARDRLVQLDQSANDLAVQLVTEAAAARDWQRVRRLGGRLSLCAAPQPAVFHALASAHEASGEGAAAARARAFARRLEGPAAVTGSTP